jgi:hypothetical protein
MRFARSLRYVLCSGLDAVADAEARWSVDEEHGGVGLKFSLRFHCMLVYMHREKYLTPTSLFYNVLSLFYFSLARHVLCLHATAFYLNQAAQVLKLAWSPAFAGQWRAKPLARRYRRCNARLAHRRWGGSPARSARGGLCCYPTQL